MRAITCSSPRPGSPSADTHSRLSRFTPTGDISPLTAAAPVQATAPAAAPAGAGTPVTAPLAGTLWKVIATEGQTVAEGDVLLILEAMKMETEIRAAQAGTVRGIAVKSGDAVAVGDTLLSLA